MAGKKARCGHCGQYILVPDGPIVPAVGPARGPGARAPAEAEAAPDLPPSPVRSFFGFVARAVRLVLLAALLAGVVGAVGDLLTPLAPVNLIAGAGLAGVAVLLRIVALASGSLRTGLAFLFLLCLGAGFGGWWALAEFHGGKPRAFLAQHSGPCADLQTAILKRREALFARTTEQEEKSDDAREKGASGEAEKNPRAAVEKALKDFPLNCLHAEAEGEPEVVDRGDDKATLAVKVRLQARPLAFDHFTAGLLPVLERIARDKGDFALTAQPAPSGALELGQSWPGEALPRYFGSDAAESPLKGGSILAVNTERNADMDQTKWRYFLLDRSVRPVLATLCARVFTVKVSLLDQDGGPVATDGFAAILDRYPKGAFAAYRVSCLYPGQVRTAQSGYLRDGGAKGGFSKSMYDELAPAQKGADGETLFLAAPLFFNESAISNNSDYRPDGVAIHKITLTPDRARKVRSVKCELVFEGGEAPAKADVANRGSASDEK